MSTNLLAGIAPQAGLIAQSTPNSTVQTSRTEAGTAVQQQIVQQQVANGAASSPAVIVNLSSGDKSRTASYGEGRSVDASFEKQEASENSESSIDGKKEKKGSGGTIRATA